MPLETINFSDKDAGEKFTPTPEELRTIYDKMKDPKFVELFQDYMKSMEDPETRREEEAYLRQVEREAKEGGDYSFDFVFPKPGFVVELLEPSTSYRMTHPSLKGGDKRKKQGTPRVLINMCSSEKIDPFREETTGERERSNWLVPVSVSKPRTELFSKEENTTVSGTAEEKHKHANSVDEASPVVVYDAVFHPDTLQLADRSDRFSCFLVNIAVEHINSGYGDRHGFEFSRLPSRIRSVGTPQNQTITRKKGTTPFSAAMNEPVLKHPTKVLPPLNSSNDDHTKPPSCDERKKKGTDNMPTMTSKAERGNGDVVVEKKKMEHLPHYTILHRGHIDLSDTWGWKIVDRRIGVPEALVVKLEFTGVRSAADLNIEVESTYIIILKSSLHPYHGTVTLPFSVKLTPLEAKFERQKSVLTLVLSVLPPEPTGITAECMRQELFAGGEDSSLTSTKDISEGATSTLATDQDKPSSSSFAATEAPITKACGVDDVKLHLDSSLLPEESHPSVEDECQEPPAVPQVSCIGDQDRVRLMMEKVQMARLQREKAAAEAEMIDAQEKKNESSLEESECPGEKVTVDPEQEPSQEKVEPGLATVEGPMPTITSNTTAVEEVTNAAGTAGPVHDEDSAVSARDTAELELDLLRQRQESWQRGVQQRIEENEEQERQAALLAEREAHREAERLRKQAEVARQQEAAEVKLSKRMAELPLRNRHIFAID